MYFYKSIDNNMSKIVPGPCPHFVTHLGARWAGAGPRGGFDGAVGGICQVAGTFDRKKIRAGRRHRGILECKFF